MNNSRVKVLFTKDGRIELVKLHSDGRELLHSFDSVSSCLRYLKDHGMNIEMADIYTE